MRLRDANAGHARDASRESSVDGSVSTIEDARLSDRGASARHIGMAAVSPVLALHSLAAARLRRGELREAVAPLARLALSLGADHPARPGVLTTLAHVYLEIGLPERALKAATSSLELGPGCSVARGVLRAARDESVSGE